VTFAWFEADRCLVEKGLWFLEKGLWFLGTGRGFLPTGLLFVAPDLSSSALDRFLFVEELFDLEKALSR
jgi:hypothetical protein